MMTSLHTLMFKVSQDNVSLCPAQITVPSMAMLLLQRWHLPAATFQRPYHFEGDDSTRKEAPIIQCAVRVKELADRLKR